MTPSHNIRQTFAVAAKIQDEQGRSQFHVYKFTRVNAFACMETIHRHSFEGRFSVAIAGELNKAITEVLNETQSG